MKIKVIGFHVTPQFIILDEEGNVVGEDLAPKFIMYPGKPFNIYKTIADIEAMYTPKDVPNDPKC